ncbi:MAG TPA: T9SS type A sorting domain-containing protein [Saprospiraceae bacterium]|nr:T9SS type A sorting domain-containing protein [Saprospiraceae bacterium]
MKKLWLMLVLLSVVIALNGQPPRLAIDFAPVGSHWYYTNIPSFFSSDQDYVEIISIGDTVVQGKNCRHLQKTYRGFQEKDEFVYTSGDTVFRLAANDTFYVLYNFAAKPGESWRTRASILEDGSEEMELRITVDSVSEEIINGYTLKVLYTSSDNSAISFGGYWGPIGRGRIIERLGGTWYMFPFNYGFLDGQIRIGLRCYSDDTLGFYDAHISQSCDEIITSTENSYLTSPKIYPNPFADELTVDLSNGEVANITLSNIHGQLVLQQAFSNTATINTDHLPAGMYFYEISDDQSVVRTGKMIRE